MNLLGRQLTVNDEVPVGGGAGQRQEELTDRAVELGGL